MSRREPARFTLGAFALLFDSEGRVLLCRRRDFDAWNLPGGGIESGELPTEAVVRETREETGLEVEVERLVGVYGKADKSEIVFAFACAAVGGSLEETDESAECRWFAMDEIPANTLPRHVERILDAKTGAPAPIFRRHTAPSSREARERAATD